MLQFAWAARRLLCPCARVRNGPAHVSRSALAKLVMRVEIARARQREAAQRLATHAVPLYLLLWLTIARCKVFSILRSLSPCSWGRARLRATVVKLIHVCCLIAGVARCSIPMASHCRGRLEFATFRKRRKQHWRGAEGNTVCANLNLAARACPQNWNQIWCAERVHKFVLAIIYIPRQLVARTVFGT